MSEESYETLPDLLADLKKMAVAVNFDDVEPFNGGWQATIRCGENYHRFEFVSYAGCMFGDTNKELSVEDNEEGFPDMDSLNVALNHVRDYISNNEEISKANLSYKINANGGKPHLQIVVSGTYNNPVRYEKDKPSIFADLLPDRYSIRPYLHALVLTPLVLIPTMIAIKKLEAKM
jgi:hypothetical protein